MRAVQLALLCVLFASASASSVLLFGGNVKQGASAQLEVTQLSSLAAAVSGLLPAQPISAQTSHQLERVLKPTLRKPAGLVIINAAGLSAEDAGLVLRDRAHAAVDMAGKGCVVMAATQALTELKSANPAMSLIVLDSILPASAPASLSLPNGAALDMSKDADLMFATELSSVQSGLKAVQQSEDVVVEVNLMGLHALSHAYGPESEVVAGAKQAVQQFLSQLVESLDTAFGGDVVYQVTITTKAPAEGVKALATWKDSSRRTLLQATWAKPDEVNAAKRFSAKAAGYGSFILLLYFSLAAMHCMCNMPFKVDTLLFPGAKKDQ